MKFTKSDYIKLFTQIVVLYDFNPKKITFRGTLNFFMMEKGPIIIEQHLYIPVIVLSNVWPNEPYLVVDSLTTQFVLEDTRCTENQYFEEMSRILDSCHMQDSFLGISASHFCSI